MNLRTLHPPAWHRVATQMILPSRGYGPWEWRISGEQCRELSDMLTAGHIAMVTRQIAGGLELLVGAVPPMHKPTFGAFSDARRQERHFGRIGI